MPGIAFIKAGTLDDTSWLDLKCMSIAIARSTGLQYPKAVKNSEKCQRSFER